MKAPESLIEKIWKECALEVAAKFKERRPFTPSECREAALLAMEKQAEFFRWAALTYLNDTGTDSWFDDVGNDMTELELYNIWRDKP